MKGGGQPRRVGESQRVWSSERVAASSRLNAGKANSPVAFVGPVKIREAPPMTPTSERDNSASRKEKTQASRTRKNHRQSLVRNFFNCC